MSTPYAGAAVFPSTGPLPDDGDAKTAASVNVAFEALFDRTVYIINFLLGAYPGGQLLNGTLKGDTTIRNSGLDNACNFVGVDINIDDVSTVRSRAPWIVSQGDWSFGGLFGQTLSLGCPVFLSGPLSIAGPGRIRQRKQYTASGDFDRVISAASTDVYIVQAGEISPGNKGLVQDGTGDASLTSWDVIRIVSQNDLAFPLYRADGVTAIEDPNESNIVMKKLPVSAGEYATVLLMWNGATWEMIGQ